MVNISGIYMIYNTINGHKYIGSAVKCRFGKNGRWNDHIKGLMKNEHHSIYLQRAWNKYGKESFVFGIIEECSMDKLIEREQYWIDYYNPEYNMCPTAGSRLGMKATEETKKKLREAHLGKHLSEEHKKSLSLSNSGENNPFFGKKHTEESKNKMRESLKGRIISEEQKKKISVANKGKLVGEKNPMFGKDFTEEHRRKISVSLTGRVVSEETKKKISESNKGRIISEETKKKISQSKKGENHPNFGEHLSEETKEKISLSLTGKKHSEERKKRIRENRTGKCKGTENPAAKLNWDIAKEIRQIYSKGETTLKQLAITYNVDPSTISDIVRNKTWIVEKEQK